MVYILGVNLPDRRLVKIALTAFQGIGHNTSRLICARLGFPDRLSVAEMQEDQLNKLSAYLSAPSSFMGSASTSLPPNASVKELRIHNHLANLLIESDLRRQVRADIAHHRAVGSYRGRRHAMGLPVRGQRTKTNAKTAKALNKVERRAFSTVAGGRITTSGGSSRACPRWQPSTLLHSLQWRYRQSSS